MECFVYWLRGRLRVSQGERGFISASLGIGILGAVLAYVGTSQLSGEISMLDRVNPFAYWTIFAGLVGGLVGFFAGYRRWLGHAGALGWIRAIFGALMISLIGAVVAGTMILPYYGTMFAPFQVILMMIETPLLAVVWVAMILSAHCMILQWRQERDSIFAPQVG